MYVKHSRLFCLVKFNITIDFSKKSDLYVAEKSAEERLYLNCNQYWIM